MWKYLFAALAFSSAAFAGNEVRNGGDAIVCRGGDGEITSVEVLDSFEMRELHGKPFNLGPADSSVEEMLNSATEHLKVHSPIRASFYREKFATFLEQSTFLNAELVNIPDSYEIGLPAGCELKQLAIYSTANGNPAKPYTVNKSLWDRLDNQNKAMLILHEVAYREARNYGHENSVNARRFVARIASGEISEMTFRDYVFLLQGLRYGSTDMAGVEVDLFHRVGDGKHWYDVGCRQGKRLYDFNLPILFDNWREDGQGFRLHFSASLAYCPVDDWGPGVQTDFGYFYVPTWGTIERARSATDSGTGNFSANPYSPYVIISTDRDLVEGLFLFEGGFLKFAEQQVEIYGELSLYQGLDIFSIREGLTYRLPAIDGSTYCFNGGGITARNGKVVHGNINFTGSCSIASNPKGFLPYRLW